MNKNWAKEKVTFNASDFINVAKRKYAKGPDKYFDISLDEAQTLKLRNQARKNGVSVNSAILAAIIMAKNAIEKKKSPDQIGFAVDVRNRLVDKSGEACSLLASATMVKAKPKGKNFWNLALDINVKAKKALESNKALFMKRLMAPLMDPTFNDAMYMMHQGGWEGTPMLRKLAEKGTMIPVGAVLTNLGGFSLPTDYNGSNTLELIDAIFFPPVGLEQVIEVGAASLCGKLHLVSLSPHQAKNWEVKKQVISETLNILLENLFGLLGPNEANGAGNWTFRTKRSKWSGKNEHNRKRR
jgi:hypothetical protein